MSLSYFPPSLRLYLAGPGPLLTVRPDTQPPLPVTAMTDHASASRRKAYVIDTNVLIHDPNSVLQFEEHRVIIPMTVLEELDKLKSVKAAVAGECRAAIRLIDRILGEAEPELIRQGVPIFREAERSRLGTLSVLMDTHDMPTKEPLSNELNDNKIINQLVALQAADINTKVVLVTKDINMRLKARAAVWPPRTITTTSWCRISSNSPADAWKSRARSGTASRPWTPCTVMARCCILCRANTSVNHCS